MKAFFVGLLRNGFLFLLLSESGIDICNKLWTGFCFEFAVMSFGITSCLFMNIRVGYKSLYFVRTNRIVPINIVLKIII
jgi:hypothetical protein